MILIIEPKSGTDLIKFNEKRMLVRQKIESSFFIQESEPEYDFYVDEGLILGYNKDDFLEYIEIIHPSKAIYQKVDLLSLDKKSFEKIMNENTKDINIKSNEVDYCYSDLPLRAYAPNNKIESISLYVPTFYNKKSEII